MNEEPERFAVTICVHDLSAVQDWCADNIPEEFQPSMTVRETNQGQHVIRATFHNQHYAALFKLFWLK